MRIIKARTYKLPVEVIAQIESKSKALNLSYTDFISLLVKDKSKSITTHAQQLEALRDSLFSKADGQALDELIRTVGHSLADKADYLISISEASTTMASTSGTGIQMALVERETRIRELQAEIQQSKSAGSPDLKKQLFKMKFLATQELEPEEKSALVLTENRLTYLEPEIDLWHKSFDFEGFFKDYQVSKLIAQHLKKQSGGRA